MTQILVMGMHRSGTTLCFDLIRRHQEVEAAINEGVLFDRTTGSLIGPPFPSNQLDATSPRPGARAGKRSWIEFQHDSHFMTWIAKMSYPGPLILQEWCRPAVDYAAAWLDEFGDSARVIHIVRHPFAVFRSARRRWAADPVHLTNYGPINLESVCRDWAIAVGEIDKKFGNEARMLTVLYEDLVTHPSPMLAKIFGHCRLSAEVSMIEQVLQEDIAFFGKVDASRANAHREAGLEPISRSTSWLMTPWFEKWEYSDR